MAEKKNKTLMYKEKPLLRRGNMIYYGNPDDEYIVMLQIQETTKILDLDISTLITVNLQTNTIPGKERVIKSAEREGLFSALDLGEYWLTEQLADN